MKILRILLLLLIFCGSNLFGQNVKIEISPDRKLAGNKQLRSHLHSNDSGHWIYFAKYSGKIFSSENGVIIEKYDNNLKLEFSKEYLVNRKNIHSLGIRYFRDKFAWLQYEKDTREDELTFYLTQVNFEGKASKPKQIAKFDYQGSQDFPDISWRASPDTTKLLFIAESDRNTKREDYETYVAVYDNEFNKLWGKKVKLPHTQRQVNTESWMVTENGDVYFLARVFENNKLFNNEYDMDVYKITEDDKKKFQLKLGDSYVKGMQIAKNEFDDDIVIVGFIGDSRGGPIQGAGYVKIDGSTSKIKLSEKRNFTTRELEKFGRKNTSRDRKSRDEGLDASFIFRDIVFKKDGTFQVLAEEYREIVSQSTSSSGSTNARTKFINNHIIVMDFDTDGKVERASIIPKKFVANKSGYPKNNILYEKATDFMFYTTFKTDDQLYFLYNDSKTNFKRGITDVDKYKVTRRYDDVVTVIGHIDENGRLRRKELFDGKELNSLLMPKHSKQINENQIFFFTKKSNFIFKENFRFGVMTITE